MKIIPIIALCAFSTGCASVMKGNDQTLAVNTIGCNQASDVTCTVINKDNNHYTKAPGTIIVEKGKRDLLIRCESEDGTATGTATLVSTYEAVNAGNILLGGFIGLGVDAATGAMWHFPKSVTVPMRCEPHI